MLSCPVPWFQLGHEALGIRYMWITESRSLPTLLPHKTTLYHSRNHSTSRCLSPGRHGKASWRIGSTRDLAAATFGTLPEAHLDVMSGDEWPRVAKHEVSSCSETCNSEPRDDDEDGTLKWLKTQRFDGEVIIVSVEAEGWAWWNGFSRGLRHALSLQKVQHWHCDAKSICAFVWWFRRMRSNWFEFRARTF